MSNLSKDDYEKLVLAMDAKNAVLEQALEQAVEMIDSLRGMLVMVKDTNKQIDERVTPNSSSLTPKQRIAKAIRRMDPQGTEGLSDEEVVNKFAQKGGVDGTETKQ